MQSNFAWYVRWCGVGRGARLYATLKWRRGLIDVNVPGVSQPLAVRAGTSDREALMQVFANGEYDTPRYPGQPRLIIDAGANVGFAAVRFATLYPGATIVAIEPDSSNCAVLDRNAARCPSLRVVRAAVWPRTAALTIENPEAKPWSFRVREARAGEPAVEAVSIPGILADSGHSTIDVLKMDVEGTERELFADPTCDEWLSRTNMLFVETHDRFRPGCEAALAAAAARHAFRRSRSGENVVLIREKLLD